MSNPVGVSEAASLALHATAIMAGAGGDPIPTAKMAGLLGASEAHLSKVLQRLAKAGLVQGTRGPGGGFRLTHPPRRTSLRQVYEAIEGRIEVNRCLLGVPVCGQKSCPLGKLLEHLGREVRKGLTRITLADLEVPAR